jgi:hypothetical protein
MCEQFIKPEKQAKKAVSPGLPPMVPKIDNLSAKFAP